MRFTVQLLCAGLLLAVGSHAQTLARGFGAARGGFAVGPRGARAGAGVGRYGGAYAGGAQGRTWVGPRGTEVQAGRAGGVAVGPYGGVHAGGAEGVKVT